jgi:septum formation protein
MARTKLILASSSPRRAEILRHAGIPFEVRRPNVDETRLRGEDARKYVTRLAKMKACAVAEHFSKKNAEAIIMGADTVVVAGRKILGKPVDVESAREMLRLLSGKTHQVLTGVALIQLPSGRGMTAVEKTRVTFVRLSAAEIDKYLMSGEPFHKAGAYAIQGIAGRFVTKINGCYFNVVGLPLSRVWGMLREMGWEK